jgi:hypothetical protein
MKTTAGIDLKETRARDCYRKTLVESEKMKKEADRTSQRNI